MTEFRVEVVRLGPIEKHPNADTLGITQVHGGYPVVCRIGEYAEGQLATYIPIDAIVPESPEWAFLGGSRRIKAKKLRGVFSMGMLARAPDGSVEGDNVQERLGIEKYEPYEPQHGGPNATRVKGVCLDNEVPGPSSTIPNYDLEGLRKYMRVIELGEQVYLTEKIHGENGRFFHDGTRLWVGSRTNWKKLDSDCGWSRYAREHDIEKRLREWAGICFYGELYGNTELKYGATNQARGFRIFDVLDTKTGSFIDSQDFWSRNDWPFERVPLLAEGPWSLDMLALAEGESTLDKHVREGFVVKPAKERWDARAGRVAFKFVGQGYLTRKEA